MVVEAKTEKILTALKNFQWKRSDSAHFLSEITQIIKLAADTPQLMMNVNPYLSGILHNCHYFGIDQNATTEAHLIWAETATKTMPIMPKIQHRNGDRLRIGYLVSNGNMPHPTNFFTHATIKHHDRQRFETYIFDSTIRSYQNLRQTCHWWYYAQEIKESAEHYYEVSKLNDIALTELLYKLGIDIIVDAAVHMCSGRPLVLAMFEGFKIIAGACPSTSGLQKNIYLLGDQFHTPPEYNHLYSEKIIRMARGMACFTLPNIPERTRAPAERSDWVTFSMFNNQLKTCRQYLRLVDNILTVFPDSRLLIGNGTECELGQLKRIFSEYGERVEYIPRCPHDEFVKQWDRVDVNLDPVWYSGSTTTLEAMLYGVPTITLSGGERACQRHSESFMRLTGHLELIAYDDDEYIRLACELAKDKKRLKAYRQELQKSVLDTVGNCKEWMIEFESIILRKAATRPVLDNVFLEGDK